MQIVIYRYQPVCVDDQPSYAARVEGRSSHARRGILVHFTAPTIHSGFKGPIALEIKNLRATAIDLTPNVYIC
jgi:dCTP deaminase